MCHMFLNGSIAFSAIFLCVTFFSSNLSGTHLRKGDKFALDRHDGTARHIDGKGRVVVFPSPKYVAVYFSPY